MKIAIITNGSLPVPSVKGGGVETLTTQFINQNEKYGKNEIVVFSIENKEAEDKSKEYKHCKFVFMKHKERTILDRIKYRLLRKYSINSPYSYKRCIKCISNNSFDRVILENSTWPLEYASKRIGDKLWLHLHNDWINNECDKKTQKIFTNSINRMGGVIVVSNYIRKRILTLPDVTQEKIVVLKNCTDNKIFNGEKDAESIKEIKNKYNIGENEIVLIFTGRISEQKGLLQLIKAFNILETEKEVRLLIVGSSKSGEKYIDTYTKKVLDEIDKSNKKITFTGYIPYEQLNRIYAVADIAILPSMWEDPAPLTVFESMSMGLPIITTNSGGIPEYANEECAIICEKESNVEYNLKKAIEKLVEDEDCREKMGVIAKETSLDYTVEKFYDDFCMILK